MDDIEKTFAEELPPKENQNKAAISPLRLEDHQRALMHALEDRNIELAIMYKGGLQVLADISNPDRFSLCAHSLRELMEKIPRHLNVSTKAQTESLKVKVREIEESFKIMQQKTKCFSIATDWDGAVDGPLRKFLRQLTGFLEWFAAHHPRRRAEINGTLERLDGTGRTLPQPLASLNVDAWDKKRDYFQSVAHHLKKTNEDEFCQWVYALERFLLERLRPRTFDDFSEIDAIIREESTNG